MASLESRSISTSCQSSKSSEIESEELFSIFVTNKCDRMLSKQIELLSVVQLLDCA